MQRRNQIILGLAVIAWTGIAWGGRIGLMTGEEEWTSALRVGGSLLIGLAAGMVLLVPWLDVALRPVLYLFVGWTVVLWTRSLIVNWIGSGSLPFKLVHTVLGAGFFALCWFALRASARRNAIPAPDEGDSEQQGYGETAGLA